MKKDVRVYNVLFPVWMLVTLPMIWWIVIPGNFIIDSLVLFLAAKRLKAEDPKGLYKRHILPVFLFGFLSDILAAIPMWGGVLLELGGIYGDSPLLTVPGVALAGGLIFVFNYFITFRKCEKPLRKKLSLILAVATAPYTFLIPSAWIY
ncbi:MAG: hypothetical protein IKC09_07985 [Oscillospiraceae bacterium]|nr:hypothetical protein [Oscillospiraceae bacterium]MBR2890197.1 hypothetical protein [Oscillospiraceae bacterium]